MANKNIFSSKNPSKGPFTDTTNNAGGRAYSMVAKHALAQLASTGFFNDTFYVKAEDQVTQVLELAKQVEPEFVAKLAVYAREKGFMKDTPAYLVAYLSTVSPELLGKVFPRVIDNGKMLRNFVQIIRSGVVGRTSFGSAPKRLIRKWFDSKSDKDVFWMSVGNDPSLADVIKLVRPRPANPGREALYAYFLDKKPKTALPEIVERYEHFRLNPTGELPEAPFEMLTGMTLLGEGWKQVAKRASWTQTRMNLATFARHGVFKDYEMVKLIAERLRNPNLIEKARVFPYQLMMAYLMTEGDPLIPIEITNALQDAMEIATKNVPSIKGNIVVAVDISGSMHSPVTGDRGDSRTTSKVRYIDVAALVGASLARVNPNTRIIPFETKALTSFKMNPRDSVMTNAEKLTKLPAGGTNCAAPLQAIAEEDGKVDLFIYVSDNESWIDQPSYGRFSGAPGASGWGYGGGDLAKNARTATMTAWEKVKRRNPNAKLVCIDISPNGTVQATNRKDILNIGGFSDNVFSVIEAFASSEGADQWVDAIEATAL